MQQKLWVATSKLSASIVHVFYEALISCAPGRELRDLCRILCASTFNEAPGRHSVSLGVYVRMIFVGHFEDIVSHRMYCVKVPEHLSLRNIPGGPSHESTQGQLKPDAPAPAASTGCLREDFRARAVSDGRARIYKRKIRRC